MAGPDLDLLFGEAPEAPKVHPALLSAVQSLAREAWPRAREELLAGGRARRPLPAALARDLDAALEHLGREEWAACGEKAEAVRSEAWQALMRDKGWQSRSAASQAAGGVGVGLPRTLRQGDLPALGAACGACW